MTTTLEEMLDRQAIVDLTIAYGWVLDHGPRERLREVFTDDAVAVFGGVEHQGVDEIITRVDSALGRLSISQHIISNQQVELDGDTGTARCYLHAQHTLRGADGGDNFVMAGRYIDQVVRTPEGWRISHRQLLIDWTEGNPMVVSR